METNKKILGKINTQRCSVTLTALHQTILLVKGKGRQEGGGAGGANCPGPPP
jgi:hypothetical protein